MVHELADYERAASQCHLGAEQLQEALFGKRPALFGHVAEEGAPTGGSEAGSAADPADTSAGGGRVVGFALWFLNFSTWRGTHGIYLEDLYVRPADRRGGHGRALLRELARIAVERGWSRVEWSVLSWNEPSIRFYQQLGARPMDEWTVYRLADDALPTLATTPSMCRDEPRAVG